jgi:predicted hydrocarbon binding protein
MKRTQEKLGEQAAVKGTMLQAHLAWAIAELGEAWMDRVPGGIDPLAAVFVRRGVLATDLVPFRALIEIDRAIAKTKGGVPEAVFHALGRHSATSNLAGAYKGFVQEETHRFFEQTSILHRRFQNFGRFTYERTGDRSGRIRIDGCEEFSPAYCLSGIGYYEGALETLGSPGPIRIVETHCQCAGDAACVFEVSW